MKRLLFILLFCFICSSGFATDWTDPANGCDNTYLMDETSGAIIDSCGSNDLSSGGSPSYSETGVFGTSIGFNGSSYFSAAQADVSPTPLSVVMWVKPDNITSENIVFFLGRSTNTVERQMMILHGGVTDDPVWAFSQQSGSAYSAKTSFTTGWNHVAAVFTSSTSRIAYLNGVAGTENTSSNNPTSPDTTAIGMSRDSTPSGGTSGDIDEVGIFGEVLSSTDINDIMDNGLVQAPIFNTSFYDMTLYDAVIN